MKAVVKRSLAGWGISLGLGLAVWVFFGVFYRHHLHYQEQMQLFLNTSACFTGLLARPGGLAVYAGSFLTQFFYDSFLGASGLAVLAVALQRLTADAAGYVCRKPLYRLLSCIPSVLYAVLLCDEDILVSGWAALVVAMGAVAGFNRLRNPAVRLVLFLPAIPLLYWAIGVAAVVFPAACLAAEWTGKGKTGKPLLSGVTLAAVALCVLSPLAAKALVLYYPMERFWLAGDYYRYVTNYPAALLMVILLTAFLPLLYRYLPGKEGKRARLAAEAGQLLALASVAFLGVRYAADWDKEEVMAYDYYARDRKWSHIIALADRKAPGGPLTVAMLNLSLSREGLMPDYMFTYFQNGTGGLAPDFTKEYIVAAMTGEIYYHLGLVNTAQRFAFEAMESIPDYRKSVRCIKRLAETNLINGQYAVAEKYLAILQHTTFYRAWATETLACLGDEERINAHPEWGRLRQFRPGKDFLFSEGEKDMMFGILFQHNPGNYMAYEYLLAHTLLNRDLQHFLEYYRMGAQKVVYRSVPRVYQEALAFIWSQTQYSPALRPEGISEETLRRLEAYRSAYALPTRSEAVLKKQFGDTYWYYYHFRK